MSGLGPEDRVLCWNWWHGRRRDIAVMEPDGQWRRTTVHEGFVFRAQYSKKRSMPWESLTALYAHMIVCARLVVADPEPAAIQPEVVRAIREAAPSSIEPRCTWARGWPSGNWIVDRDRGGEECGHAPYAVCPKTGQLTAAAQPRFIRE